MEDNVLDRLCEIVGKHYNTSNQPLLLSRLGTMYPELRAGILKAGYETLSAAVAAVGEDRLQIVRIRNSPGRTSVVVPEKRSLIEQQLMKATERAAETGQFAALPYPIQLAFCVSTEPNERVVVRINPPFRYTKLGVQETPESGSVLVEDEFRKPGLRLENASSTQKTALWRAFLAWAERHDVDSDMLLRVQPHLTALERLLAAQDPDILSKLKIPGDIAELLIRHR
jgi:hypothetical protein